MELKYVVIEESEEGGYAEALLTFYEAEVALDVARQYAEANQYTKPNCGYRVEVRSA